MLFGLLRDKSPEQKLNHISCALCSTVVSQSCATQIGESPNEATFACFRCFAKIIIERRQTDHVALPTHQRAA